MITYELSQKINQHLLVINTQEVSIQRILKEADCEQAGDLMFACEEISSSRRHFSRMLAYPKVK